MPIIADAKIVNHPDLTLPISNIDKVVFIILMIAFIYFLKEPFCKFLSNYKSGTIIVIFVNLYVYLTL